MKKMTMCSPCLFPVICIGKIDAGAYYIEERAPRFLDGLIYDFKTMPGLPVNISGESNRSVNSNGSSAGHKDSVANPDCPGESDGYLIG